jgi:hypothetical protein
MLGSQQVEELVTLVCGLDKEALLRQFSEYPSAFPLERLRHLFVAICLQSQRMPAGAERHASTA